MKRLDATYRRPEQLAREIGEIASQRGEHERYTHREAWERYGFLVLTNDEADKIPDIGKWAMRRNFVILVDTYYIKIYRIIGTDIIKVRRRNEVMLPGAQSHIDALWIFPVGTTDPLKGIQGVP